jgi:hypothetical protein
MASATLGSGQHSLPTELVLLIVESLAHDNKTLCALAQTCRALQYIAEEQIYKTIRVSTVRDLRDIIYAFSRRRDRASSVHKLVLHYQYQAAELDSTLESRSVFNECVVRMTNLRQWYIESPYDNSGNWDKGDGPEQWVRGDMEEFRGALELACTEGPAEAERIQAERRLGNMVDRTVGLALLERLTIHSHGIQSDFWPLDDFHCLFRHPNLRFLHISCVDFTLAEGIPSLQSSTVKTPLDTLIFDECEISPECLRDILRMPAKLTSLELGENVFNTYHSRTSNPRLTRNARATIEALGGVAHSLETLVHLDPSSTLIMGSHKENRMSLSGEGMRHFHALKYIQCDPSSFLHQAVIKNHELAPPNLHTLRLITLCNGIDNFYERLPDVEPYLALPSLARLELVQSDHPRHELNGPASLFDAELIQRLHAFAFKLHRAGIATSMFVEMHMKGLIPPFLYGEKKPSAACIYDSSEVGFAQEPSDDETAADRMQLPETDQLSAQALSNIKIEMRSVVARLRGPYEREPRRMTYAAYMAEHFDDEEYDDEEYDDDEMDFEMEYDDEMDEAELNAMFGEPGIEVYMEVPEGWESETESVLELMALENALA